MSRTVDIDPNSGFCAGVIRAIECAEHSLDESSDKHLFSLGSIVHNEEELDRLYKKGLVTIDLDDLADMAPVNGTELLIRAHGEPPSTYARAKELGFEVIDCTCPVVLKLQANIREAYRQISDKGGRIVIFGKVGHAEVLGLLGQVNGDALVVEDLDMLMSFLESGDIKTDVPVEIFSQTTKSPLEYEKICGVLTEAVGKDNLKVHNTICAQVSTRHNKLSQFAMSHDILVFVSGRSSSNGRVLCNLCKSLNIRTYHITSTSDINPAWFCADDRVGVCGATSTPKWLLEKVAAFISGM